MYAVAENAEIPARHQNITDPIERAIAEASRIVLGFNGKEIHIGQTKPFSIHAERILRTRNTFTAVVAPSAESWNNLSRQLGLPAPHKIVHNGRVSRHFAYILTDHTLHPQLVIFRHAGDTMALRAEDARKMWKFCQEAYSL